MVDLLRDFLLYGVVFVAGTVATYTGLQYLIGDK